MTPEVSPELLSRLDVNGPRYTSYPTADRFVEAFGVEQYQQALQQRGQGVGALTGGASALSVYVHIPFCDSVCYYCACNKVITKDHSRSARYIRALAQEMALVAGHIGPLRRVTQLHWGGGTPTFLTHDEMRAVMAATRAHFDLMPDAEISVELDPRHADDATLEVLAENTRAIALYEKLDFRHVGTLHAHYLQDNRWHDVVLMERMLAP